jgi:hypothetical protein
MPTPSTPEVTATPNDASGQPGQRGPVLDRPAPGTVAAQRARAGRHETARLVERGEIDLGSAKPSVPQRSSRLAPPPPDDDDGERQDADREDDTADPRARETREEPARREPEAERKADEDPETKKRVGAISAAEKRAKDAIAAEKKALADYDKELETKWLEPIKQAKEFQAIRAEAGKAITNPAKFAKLMSSLGLKEEHYELMAHALYSMSPAGKADPARAKHVAQLMRDREIEERLDETKGDAEERISKLEQKLAEQEQQSRYASARAEYVRDTLDAITDEFPIAAAALDASATPADATPEQRKAAAARRRKLEDRLHDAAVEVQRASDDPESPPDPRDVIAHFEKTRRAELEELGVAPPTRESKTNRKPAEKKTPATTLSSDLSTSRASRPSLGSGRAHRMETVRMLEQGKLT